MHPKMKRCITGAIQPYPDLPNMIGLADCRGVSILGSPRAGMSEVSAQRADAANKPLISDIGG
jgi:hypothetical protein